MCNSVKDKSWDSDCPGTSVTPDLGAITSSTSGWGDLVEFYQAEAESVSLSIVRFFLYLHAIIFLLKYVLFAQDA